MAANQRKADASELQNAVNALALSLDAFLVNGIQYGVLEQAIFGDFLQQTINDLLRDLDGLERSAGGIQPTLTRLRTKVQELIAVVRALCPFKTLAQPQVHALVSQVPLLRSECADLIQQLETELHVDRPFYRSRPAHSTVAMNEFLSNLHTAFAGAMGP
jgi:hypothetical protein